MFDSGGEQQLQAYLGGFATVKAIILERLAHQECKNQQQEQEQYPGSTSYTYQCYESTTFQHPQVSY
jgi:hypothetical protein